MSKKTIALQQHHSNRVMINKVPAAAFFPGSLVELTSADKVQKHSTQNGVVAPAMFALEDANQGKTIDDAYATTGIASVWIPQKGDVVYGILADGQNVSVGSLMGSNGDGTMKIHTANIVAISLEALDLSDSSGAETEDSALGYDKRFKMMIV